jgi:murein DD-endopeptidase MepM/ murein hydrolase activator NlpD
MQSDRFATAFVPALLGVAAALGLGGAGFALGSLSAGLTAATVPRADLGAKAPPFAPAAAPAAVSPAPAMGGPEEPLPVLVASSPPLERPLAAPRRPTPGEALAMFRPVQGGWVSSRFGQRLDPFTGRPAIHRGLDFAGVDNTAILAVAPGVVTWSGRQRGYGHLIEIDHGRGWVTRYGHNASNLVRPGDYVKPGQTIALMGSTGRATGTHLHFEVLYRGRHQNPARFVPQDT